VREGVLHSVIFGMLTGAVIGFITFLVGAFTRTNVLWVGLAVTIVIAAVASWLFYRFRFRPTIEAVARRIDLNGLQERTITMVELQHDDSFMAKVQRENATQELSKHTFQLVHAKAFLKPLLVMLCALILMGGSLGFMITQVNAAIDDPPITDEPTDDEIFQEMIDELLSIINNANIDVELKSELYGMVVDLEARIPTYDTYMEKYTDVLETRNEILQLIEDNILELEDSLMNIAEELQKYETTEVLGLALATWDDDQIIAAFEYMYDRIDELLGQELYDDMLQTAIDIETALADAAGTDEAMAAALQQLADAYRAAIEDFQPGDETETLDDFQVGQDAALQELLAAVQALRELVEELMELQEELEEEIEQVDEFPMFLPWPEDDDSGEEPNDPDTTSENMVIDGETPYEDVYDSYYEEAMDWLTSESLPEEMRQIIENYFDMLK